jgi:hypothetical protein
MGMIRVLDFVDHCYNSDDGQIIHDIIAPALSRGGDLTVSFDGVDSVPSSFVNVALISLLDQWNFDEIKRRLRFVDTNSQINEMIRDRFAFEVNRRTPR